MATYTIASFREKYGTDNKYEEYFQKMCMAGKNSNPCLAYDFEEFVKTLKRVCETEFDKELWRDYKFICSFCGVQMN